MTFSELKLRLLILGFTKESENSELFSSLNIEFRRKNLLVQVWHSIETYFVLKYNDGEQEYYDEEALLDAVINLLEK